MNRLVLPPGVFRLVLALAVVTSHVSRLDIGRLAVLLFFLLSGYWVARIWRTEFASRRWGAFYASRWLRIAPLYFLALTAASALRGIPIQLENLLLLGVDTTHRDPIGVAWSLDIELQFYLLLPLALLVPRGWRLGLAVFLTAIGWELSFRAGVNTVLMYLPAFAAGAVIERTRWAPGDRTALASLAAFGAVTAAAAIVPFTAPFLNKTLIPPFDEDLFGLVWMAPLVPYVAASLAAGSSKLDRDMGNWSYPLYLVHFPLIALCVDHGVSKWGGVAMAIPVAVGLFYGPDRLFEAGRRRLVGARPKAAAARVSV